jgi:hypothetical protein
MRLFRDTLLALLFAALTRSTAPADTQGLCGGAPVEFQQSVETIQGDLRIVLSTDRAQYALGDPVWMRLEITNLGVDSVAIQSTGDPMERFELYPDSCVSGNCVETWTYPPMVNYSGDLIGLAPGKPQTRCAVWNGVATQGDSTVAPGIYQIVAVLATHQDAAHRAGIADAGGEPATGQLGRRAIAQIGAVTLAVLAGAAVGTINGVLVTGWKLSPIIVTLGSHATYDSLVVKSGWTSNHYEAWLADTLQRSLLV